MEKKFAVFIDGDNINPGNYSTIIFSVEKYGTILETWVYANWTQQSLKSWERELARHPAFLVQTPHTGDDATDFFISIDATKRALIKPELNAFCFASSDAHYRSIAYDMKRSGNFVLGIGKKGQSSPEWQDSCDFFVELDNGDAEKQETFSFYSEEREIVFDAAFEYCLNECFKHFEANNKLKQGWVLAADFCALCNINWKEYGGKPLKLLEKYGEKTHKLEIDRSKRGAERLRLNTRIAAEKT